QPIAPVVAIARKYRDRMPMAVATGSAGWAARAVLTQINVLDWFQTLVGAEDTDRHKPEPDVYLEAARRLNVAPTRCCAFEDTDMGLESARRAGMEAVDIRDMIANSQASQEAQYESRP
ncbi:MAG: HAD-IA family hydrolase, partial [Phycisphaeraceae bacterium]